MPHFDIESIIRTFGYVGIFTIVFVESGLLIGFFLPGDSLLFTAGFLASQGFFNIGVLLVGTFIAAVLGDSVGYSIGRRYGHRVFKRKNSVIFSHDHIARSEKFYAAHGGKTIILARFIPVVRTFAPVIAGVGKMPYKRFLFFNLIGGFIWAVGVTLMGYYLGRLIPDIDKYLIPSIIIVILISLLPSIIHLLRDMERREQIKSYARKHYRRIRKR